MGLATETDTAQTLTGTSLRVPGIASEADTAFALAAVQKLLVGAALEADTALALAGVGTGALSDAEFRQMYDWLAALSAKQLLTVGTFLALK